MLELTVRLVVSLAIVVGLMLLLARLAGKRYGARAGAPVQVLHRQALSRSASVAVVTVGGRVLVLGTTDQQVSLLTELDPDELELEELDDLVTADTAPDAAVPVEDAPALPAPTLAPTLATRGSHRATPAPRRTTTPDRTSEGGALAGSILSGQTWRQAIAAATGGSAGGPTRKAS
ncbi:flagellar protein FliO/FliZ [Nocardioides exalbidus]|uniref:Flagellar protein FliO/FliZ n=1 Tax=Nocardioides exalbidus TaxID=402596 RepID=A0A1H4N0S4_9ACTN|nr:flagellar biosynthetic protein FliO [Nocardioides exalbidus]SEB88921.1 flagellar protein FliO/FliZ [Nocardioides exalbidus]